MLGYILSAIVVIAAFAAWVALVPAAISGATFVWLCAATITVMAVVGATMRSARATRSVAHVLHDIENPSAQRP